MSKCKVLLVSNTLSCGGGERQITLIANALNESGRYDVDVLYYGQKGGAFASVLKREPFYVDKDTLGSFGCVKAIAKLLKEGRYQVVHAIGGTANLYGRAAAVLAHTPVVIGMLRGRDQLKAKGIRLVNSLLNLFCRHWSVNNPALIEVLKKDLCFVPKKVHLLYNSFQPAEEVDYRFQEETDYDLAKGNDFVFGTIGRCVAIKNFPMYLRAAKRICDAHQNVQFWLIGDGPQYELLQTMAVDLNLAEKVRFFGFRDDVDVAHSRMDVYVQSSDSEGTSNSVLEALRAARPVISTKNTDLDGIIIDGKNGFITPCADEDALVEAMEKMLSFDDASREQMGLFSFELFNCNFRSDRAVEQWDALYTQLLSKKKA